ncbi:phosphoesterase [Microvirga aerilata]|uniref:phosphoesterase n=1 Tax=Microvirga aerilata TaxID=670292 RepID=UPI0028ACE233|nr:phosphoesterase [Microvirga aerilata]
MTAEIPIPVLQQAFRESVGRFRADAPVLILGHNDADGLSASALLARVLAQQARPHRVRILGRGENPWSDEMRAELSDAPASGLIVADLGVREGDILPGTETVVIDHHVPTGTPGSATVISGFHMDPVPTSSLLSYWCAAALAEVDDLLWIAALGIIGDMAEKAGFEAMEDARKRYGITALREATALLNAPRRSASGDAKPALDLLMKAGGPKEILSGEHPETALLQAAREEVKRELEAARRVPPKVKGSVALIRFHSPCQIHPLVAQAWRGRLRNNIVLAVNTGYRPGWIHFAARTALDLDLIGFLRDNAPPGADQNYGSGHRQATGGALRPEAWNMFVEKLGFGPDLMVQP